MVEGGVEAIFPVVFYDGEKEFDIGNVRIRPSIEFKTFQSILRQKIGISANQFTIYLVEGKRSKFSPEDHRKILITGKANFSLIAREKDSFFFVVLRRSRRDRRRKPKQSTLALGEYMTENTFSRSQWPEDMLLLRRNQPDLSNLQLSGFPSPYYNQIAQAEFSNYENRLQNSLISRENYRTLISNTNWDSNVHLGLDSFPKIKDSYAVSTPRKPHILKYWCKDCTTAKNKESPEKFHLCVNDSITVGFRSRAGPINPPTKSCK